MEKNNLEGTITAFNTYHTDAYMIAVKNGFEGTEAEWLESLKGKKGDTGATGPQGKQGEIGPRGDQGEQGIQGEKGEKGEPGKDGADGYTPVRGADYWTDADKEEIKSYVDEAILGGAW